MAPQPASQTATQTATQTGSQTGSPTARDRTRLTPAEIVSAEAAALADLATRLAGPMLQPFNAALDLLEQAALAHRPLILTGVGKSGLIAQKIAATFRSTGSPAHFLHPTEALHGDLGMLSPGDTLVALSASGETEEILALLPAMERLDLKVIALCCAPASTLARAAVLALDISISAEACPHNLAPTSSTTVMLALGDALALSLSQRRGFAPEDFADLHPGGRLGLKLARVKDLMHTGDAIPSVTPATLMPDVIYEMSRKKLGLTTVTIGNKLQGIISDGDLRRMLERVGATSLSLTAADIMNPSPLTIPADTFASAALALMEDRHITALLVTSPIDQIEGVLHLHDLWRLNPL